MGSISLWHWIIVSVIATVWIWPWARACRKAGYSGWWAVFSVVPLLNVVMLWAFAYGKWPRLRPSEPVPAA